MCTNWEKRQPWAAGRDGRWNHGALASIGSERGEVDGRGETIVPFSLCRGFQLPHSRTRTTAGRPTTCKMPAKIIINCQVLQKSIFGHLHLIVDDFHAIFVTFLVTISPPYTTATPHDIDHASSRWSRTFTAGKVKNIRNCAPFCAHLPYLVASVPHVFCHRMSRPNQEPSKGNRP